MVRTTKPLTSYITPCLYECPCVLPFTLIANLMPMCITIYPANLSPLINLAYTCHRLSVLLLTPSFGTPLMVWYWGLFVMQM